MPNPIKHNALDRRRLHKLHCQLEQMVRTVKFGQDNTQLKKDCEVITNQIKAINDKARARQQA